MNDLIQARQFDSNNDYEKAIEFYEKSLITFSDDLSIYLDLLSKLCRYIGFWHNMFIAHFR